MTRIEFLRLTLNDRARVIMRKAHFLARIEYYNYHCHLYSLEDYFVEVKLTAITNDVESIHIAESYDMEKFINQIELPML